MKTRALIIVGLTMLAAPACKKKDGPIERKGPGEVYVEEAKLHMRLPASTSVTWSMVPGPELQPPSPAVVLTMPSGYNAAFIELNARADVIAANKAAYTRQAEFAKKHPTDALSGDDVMLDAPDAFVTRVHQEDNSTWCRTSACKQVGTRSICVQTSIAESSSSTVDPKTSVVTQVNKRITENDCLALVEIVRSFTE